MKYRSHFDWFDHPAKPSFKGLGSNKIAFVRTIVNFTGSSPRGEEWIHPPSGLPGGPALQNRSMN
jgi:hypothetical protein